MLGLLFLAAATPVDRAAAAYMADRCHVGLSIVARADGRTSFANFGSIRRDRVEPPTAASVYELASVTKSFTGALAAKAVVDGRMGLDADFRTYLPGAFPNLAKEGHPITLRSLATHTSGIQRDLPDSDALMAHPDFDHIGDQLAKLNKGFDRARSIEALHDVTLRTVPGARFAYSNIGIRLIGYGLDHISGLSFADLLRRDITGPLGMTETRLSLTPAMRARLVKPYSRFGHLQPYHDASAGAAYGLWSTPRDMARYLAWQLDERDPVIARAHGLIHGTSEDGQGLIWNIGRDGTERMLWHGGGSFGMTSQILLYPDSRDGYVLLANDACAGSESALKGIAMALHHHRAP
jgi:serine-type D-Ala-D-Ala carboxypeptidase/endopeptidase